jgi:hypothetical protein
MLPPDDALVPQDILHVGEQYGILATASLADDHARVLPACCPRVEGRRHLCCL